MKADPSLEMLVHSVNKICKTTTGNLFIELRRSKEKTVELQEKVEQVLVEDATMKARGSLKNKRP